MGNAGWKTASPADEVDRGNWWSLFQDAQLDELARFVALDNQNLKANEAAYRQAVAIAQAAQSGLMPQLALSPSLGRSRSSGVTTASRGGYRCS